MSLRRSAGPMGEVSEKGGSVVEAETGLPSLLRRGWTERLYAAPGDWCRAAATQLPG